MFAATGLTALKSQHDVGTTMDKLERVLNEKGMTVFTRINHGLAATKVDVALRPTQLIIFGNPKVGSPLMACTQTVAIDLPQKMLVWEDSSGQVWIGYNSPEYLKTRHDISDCEDTLGKISGALHKFAAIAAN